MRPALRFLPSMRAALLAFIAWCTATSASAQDAQYVRIPVGERAIGLGGAFTGLADDASAAFYNPAGLAFVAEGMPGGSLTVNAFDSYEVEDGYGSGVGVADLEHDASPSFPIFVGVVKKFGRRNEQGERRHAFALSTFHPHTRSVRYEVQLFDPTTGVDESLRVEAEDNIRWYGPSYALRISDRFAIGVTGFFSTRTQRHSEDQTVITRGERGDQGVFANPTLYLRESVFEFDAQHAVLRLGALWKPHPDVQLGVMLQPPGIALFGSGRVFERRTLADLLADPGYATFFRSDQDDLDVDSPVPWELRLGVAWRASSVTSAAFDVSLVGPYGSEDDPVQVLSGLQPDDVTGDTPQPGVFVVQSLRAQPVLNFAMGVETSLFDIIPLRAGVFTNFSPAPAIEGPSFAYAYDDVDTFGASLSVGVRTEGYDVNVGAAGVIGSGTGYRLNPRPGDGDVFEPYLPTDVHAQTLYVFITGHMAALRRAARTVYRETIRPAFQ